MRASAIEAFLRAIPVREIRAKAKYVTASCPFAYWNHGGRDNHPSFGVRIEPGGLSSWNCMSGTCGLRGSNLTLLVWKLEQLSGVKYPQLHDMLRVLEIPDPASLQARVKALEEGGAWSGRPALASLVAKPPEPPPPEATPEALRGALDLLFEELPDFVFRSPVLTKRTISREDYIRFGLKWQASSGRIALPVRDIAGNIRGITGRILDENRCPCGGPIVRQRQTTKGKTKMRLVCKTCGRPQGPKYLHSLGFRRDSNLFGIHLVPPGRPIGSVVEGHFDAIAGSQVLPTVAAMGSFLSPEQVRLLKAVFSAIIIFPDGDEAGAKIALNYASALRGHLPFAIAAVPDGKDPDELTPEDRRARMESAIPSLTNGDDPLYLRLEVTR